MLPSHTRVRVRQGLPAALALLTLTTGPAAGADVAWVGRFDAGLAPWQEVRLGAELKPNTFAARVWDGVPHGSTLLARISKAAVVDHLMTEPGWVNAFAAHLASEVQRTRGCAELLSLKKVGERVDAWLSLNGGVLPDRGRWMDWASELAVTPEALYRELARRRA